MLCYATILLQLSFVADKQDENGSDMDGYH
jgi:hypothetical protein